ncbi:hypothetical protein QBC46DRAFT_368172 [Diplogelasinospora grovesii]|uniref:Transmembrane protein n=1 Tax=Diplogelasinospora grovesii TaxID=303347 RepID=A0AAN6RZS4_9PEZI|nr:hypothetical protein QBC46DRAFT_368172 [Diplogelasinospora grovesii]
MSVNWAPTPRIVRRLASDHDFVLGASPSPKPRGCLQFLGRHLSIPAAFIAGIVLNVAAIVYTCKLSKQLLSCPTWAVNCDDSADRWTAANLGTVQGIITMVYLLGLLSFTSVALALCESAIWPLLSRQKMSVRQLDAYLSTTRGSIFSAPLATLGVRTIATGLVLLTAVLVTLLPLLGAAPLMGHAFTPVSQPVQLESQYTPGGGISQLYAQTDPPTSVMVGVLADYNSWAATSPSSEPLPEYREWYVDRATLAQRGNFTAKAVRLQQTISCSPGGPITQVQRDGKIWNAFTTNMNRSTSGQGNSSAEVWVRPYPQLALWANDYTFVSPTRTKATLIFAALNGTIHGGATTQLMLGNMTSMSTVACTVDIEALDGTLVVGTPPQQQQQPVLSSVTDLQANSATSATKTSTSLNEMLLWFAVAPLMVGSSVDGTQPMFYNSSSTGLPVSYTSSTPQKNEWTADGIQQFIRMAVGALAQATSTTTPANSAAVTLDSIVGVVKMDPTRAVLLVILPVLILSFAILVGGWNVWAYRVDKIPVMRLAGVDELLKSSQSQWLREKAATDAAKPYLPSELGDLEVTYGVGPDGIVGKCSDRIVSVSAQFIVNGGNERDGDELYGVVGSIFLFISLFFQADLRLD